MSDDQETQFNIDPKILIAGDITYGFRGSGNVESSSNDIDIVSPTNKNIPQITISLASYADMEVMLSAKEDNGTSNTTLNPFNSVAAVGLDALFVPYTNSISTGTPFLPHFELPTSVDVGTSKTLDPFNPFNLLAIEGKSHTEDNWFGTGHNISYALSDNPFDPAMRGPNGTGGLYPYGEDAPVDYNFEKDFFSRSKVETSGIRSIGFKSPMILSGWGYDTNGNPVPSSGGVLHPEATYNPNVWKTGPVDLRWDDARKVWTGGGGGTSAFYLCKVTNTYNPTSFSFEVDRSTTRDQYARSAPDRQRPFNANDRLYDPEYVAYYNNPDNVGQYESLDYGGVEFPYYEAFIIRSTSDEVNSSSYYNIWTEDCNDCGVIQNSCAPSGSTTLGAHSGVATARKILIENPLRQALDTGDLCFTISTGRSKSVNTGTFSGGTVSGVAFADLVVDATGGASVSVTSSGSGYTNGGFALTSGCNVCANVTLYFETGTPYGLASGIVEPNTGLKSTGVCPLQVIASDATADTEALAIHWIQQAEFKSQQVVTHSECSAGVLQTCTMKIQTQGFKTCEHCGEDTAFINAY
jgi:hypothetical protein